MSSLLTVILLNGLFLFVFSACNPPPEKSKKIDTVDIAKEISCAYTLDDGNKEYSLPGAEKLAETSFGKMFDMNRLLPLMGLSLRSTVSFIKESGKNLPDSSLVSLYYISGNKPERCKPLKEILDLPPRDQEQEWQSVSENALGVVGIYLKKGQEGIPSTNQQASILVVDHTTRWTVIHEFMHHLFQSEIAKQVAEGKALSDSQIMEDQNQVRLMDLLDKFEAAQTQEEKDLAATQLATEYRRAKMAHAEQFRRNFLEEMTIEKMLIEKYNSGEFKHTHPLEVTSGAHYIVSSYNKFFKMTSKIVQDTKDAENNFAQRGHATAADILGDVADLFERLDREAYPIAKWAFAQLPVEYRKGLSFNSIVSESAPLFEKSCSHGDMKSPEISFSFSNKGK
ncbi:MAG: hypothetical protein AB7O96_12335 [Pseudobdellovibrionaceae bacterium]